MKITAYEILLKRKRIWIRATEDKRKETGILKGKYIFLTGNPSLKLEGCYYNFGNSGLEIHRWFSLMVVLMGSKGPVH